MSRQKPERWGTFIRALNSGRFKFTADSRALAVYLKGLTRNDVTPPMTREEIMLALGWGRTDTFSAARQPLWECRVISWRLRRRADDQKRTCAYRVTEPTEWGNRLSGKLHEVRRGGAPVAHTRRPTDLLPAIMAGFVTLPTVPFSMPK